jgi:hypothetical protein
MASPAPAPLATVAPRTTTTLAPVAAPAAGTTAPPTTAAGLPIGSHDAHLDGLTGPAAVVPVGVVAGPGGTIQGPVVAAGVDPATGELAIPAQAGVVAWYQYGPSPGEGGSAVLAGHVDWHGVPGIFFRLRALAPGDPVEVTMSDGSARSFHVVAVELVEKPQLPLAEVFARTGPPTLTLVTCGGSFDASTHHYRSNVVVTASPG